MPSHVLSPPTTMPDPEVDPSSPVSPVLARGSVSQIDDKKDRYMLPRDYAETKRLEMQHRLFAELVHNQLTHPRIPYEREIRCVADVATGTGLWLRDVERRDRGLPAGEMFRVRNDANADARTNYTNTNGTSDSTANTKPRRYVAFDISDAQYPSKLPPAEDDLDQLTTEYVIHDARTRFPEQWHGAFDLVHVRFLSFALREVDLQRVIQNIVEILRPGGYIDWIDGEPSDCHATPHTADARKMIAALVEERIARGLTPLITPSILRTLSGLPIVADAAASPHAYTSPNPLAPEAMINPLTWDTTSALRVLAFDTFSSMSNSSAATRDGTSEMFLLTLQPLLQASTQRLRDMAAAAPDDLDPAYAAALKDQIAERERLLGTITDGTLRKEVIWDLTINWFLARKAVFVPKNSDWMDVLHPASKPRGK